MLTEFVIALAWCLVILAWVQGTGITLYGAFFSKACEADQELPVLLRIFFQQVPEAKTVKNRLHLDIRAAPGLRGDDRLAALEVECDRLVALGATRVQRFEAEPYVGDGFIVMQDPEGNEFCLD